METYPLNGIALLLGHRASLGARGQRSVVIGVLAKEAEELLRVLGDQLRQLRVASTKLLQDRLQHLGLLLHTLAELLELGVMSQEVEVAQAGLAAGGGSGNSSGRLRASAAASALALLGSEIEQVHTLGLASGSFGSHG